MSADRLSKPKRGVFVVGAVPSVPSVPFSYDEQDTQDRQDTNPRCEVCGFPMTELGDGATVHPACQEQS